MRSSIPAAILLASHCFAQTTTLESLSSAGVPSPTGAYDAVISGDGQILYFTAVKFGLPSPAVGGRQVWRRNRATGITEVVSKNNAGNYGNGDSIKINCSQDGNRVAFGSGASNLAGPDHNGTYDIYLRDIASSTTIRVSVSTTGGDPNGDSWWPGVAGTGRFVAFHSRGDNLVPGDTNVAADVFLRDTLLSTTERISVDSSGQQAVGGYSEYPAISADARFLVFESGATNLIPGDTNGEEDIFLRDRTAGTTQRVSLTHAGLEAHGYSRLPGLSADGTKLVFQSNAPDLVPVDPAGINLDVFRRDLGSGAIERVSVGLPPSGFGGGGYPSISRDGRWVTFVSSASDIVVGDNNNTGDVFVRDTLLGTTERVSVTTGGLEGSAAGIIGPGFASVSDHGRQVAFFTEVPLAPGDTGSYHDVYLRDRAASCPPMTSYCTAKPNSQGCTPVAIATGLPSLSGPDTFRIAAWQVIDHKNGLLLWGSTPSALPFGGGVLCVAPPIKRTPSQNSEGQTNATLCTGTYSFLFSHAYIAAHGLSSGQQLHVQWWSRDPGFAAPNNVGLTDAIAFTIAP